MAIDFGSQTLGDLVDDTKNLLKQKFRDHLNRLELAIDDSETVLELTYDMQGIRPGDLIELDSELMYIWNVDFAAEELTVERGWMSSTSVAHSAGTVITVEPRWTRQHILDTLRSEVLSWEKSSVYGYTHLATTISGAAGSTFTELPDLTEAGQIEPLRILRLDVEPSSIDSTQTWKVQNRAELLRDLPGTWSVSGWGLKFRFARGIGDERNYYLTYSHDYAYASWSETTLLDDIRLPKEQRDIPSYGVAWRILEGTEATRTNAHAQAQTRVTEEVPPGYRVQIADTYRQRRDQRLSEVSQNLQIQFPQTW